MKEKDIEAKLKQVIADWAIVELSFAPFKARGELLLKGGETGDIITALEDSLMIMNSLLSNRYCIALKRTCILHIQSDSLWSSCVLKTLSLHGKSLFNKNISEKYFQVAKFLARSIFDITLQINANKSKICH